MMVAKGRTEKVKANHTQRVRSRERGVNATLTLGRAGSSSVIGPWAPALYSYTPQTARSEGKNSYEN